MSTPKKFRGGSESELTKLKLLWRDSLSEDAKAYWRELFVSTATQAQIRQQLAARLKIKLSRDNQLNAFRDWELEQRAMDLEAERQAEEERRLNAEHPDWTKEQVRDALLKKFYNRASATGDHKLGLKTIAADVKVESLKFDQEKFKESVRTKIQSGLAELAQHIKANPKAQAAYDALEKSISEATK